MSCCGFIKKEKLQKSARGHMEPNHLQILPEDIRGEFDLVLEGHESLRQAIRATREELGEKIEILDCKLEALNGKVEATDVRITGNVGGLNRKIDDLTRKIDDVAADLASHRRDTEAHPSVYQLKRTSDEVCKKINEGKELKNWGYIFDVQTKFNSGCSVFIYNRPLQLQ